jgi:NAD(P)-dependent dehydrogenase (short-subunit alcohol dehydrogenase family)
MDHFKVNVVGPLVLFQAMEGLLRASSSSSASASAFADSPGSDVEQHTAKAEGAKPKAVGKGRFIIISSAAGSTGRLIPFKVGAYGVSKAAVNHLAVKLQQENPDLVILPLWYVPLPLYLSLTYCKGGADDQARGWYIPIWEPR